MHLKSIVLRPFAVSLVAALMLSAAAPMAPRAEPGPVKVQASETTHAVDGSHDFAVSPDSTHIAIHWPGNADARVLAAFSSDGTSFSEPAEVEIDDASEAPDAPQSAETYGALMGVDRIRIVRVSSDRPLPAVTVLAMDATSPDPLPLGLGAQAAGGTTIPTIIPRSGWAADESVRFDDAGDELWPREYFPLQKLVVHNTAGRNADPNPAATVRAIYYYHAVTKRWGDIGYNYLIDEAGRVYEGRYARDFWYGANPSSDNEAGLALAAGHAKLHNSGSMGIALLGTFTSQAPTAAAQASLVRLMAWLSAKHGIDPRGSGIYVNPLTGLTRNVANIAGHRNYASTGCPGGVLYGLLPAIRGQVAAAINPWHGVTYNPSRTLRFTAGTYVGRRFSSTGAITATKSYTLSKASSAPTNQWATNPAIGGHWYFVTAGVWAGYWIEGTPRITMSGPPPVPVLQTFDTARWVSVPAGTYVGRRFSTWGDVTASKSVSLPGATAVWATQRSTIPMQAGNWYYITVGPLRGYWIPETAGMTLGAPPPPLPVPIAIYNPPLTLRFAAGTYEAARWSAYGVLAGSMTYTLSTASSAPTSRYSMLPAQSGNWYYIIEGVFEGYWVRESSRLTLGGPYTMPVP